jgi:chromosome segregation ATPase
VRLQVCARLECEIRPVQELRIEIASLESRVQTEQKRLDGFSILQLQERYERAQQSYDTIKTELGALERLLQRIEDGLVERVKSFIQLRAQIQKHVSAYFGYYIHMRGHYGSIKFDDRSQEMRLRVAISHHRTHEGELCFAQDLRSLSGGERSFTTLALMLALGEAMEAPFRIMDEFDVFMDEANRRVAYKTLIDIAKRESRRQFVFITPLTLPNLRADPECVRVVRLVPPVRGTDNVQQTILDDFAPNAGDVTDPQ